MTARWILVAPIALASLSAVFAQNNPFTPPRASVHYAPDRTADLLHLSVDLDVDYQAKRISGHAVNTFSALRTGVKEIQLHAGQSLRITKVTLNGLLATYDLKGDVLTVNTGPLRKGQRVVISIDYISENSKGRSFGYGGGGWHWIDPRPEKPKRMGFWTQGETDGNRQWAPTFDHPSDLTTSETRTTVPADWTVVGNGVLVSNKLSADKKKRTFEWRMTQPHATYLLSLCGGPLDVKKDKWEGVDLWYVVPAGAAELIDDSFGDTKDMLSFFSKVLGVKYPWPKYAQDAMYDFGGGMENVSATTMGEGSLTSKRDGFRRMASLNSHELAHQWFGDFVTCRDWGDTWLNESFATFMEALYMEHSRGTAVYQREIDNDMSSYFMEARRYKRPLSTKLYPNADSMFDSHSYPKGGAILHTLRRYLGDEAFFGGLKLYLTRHAHTPVQAAQLARAFSDASGIDCDRFFDQWIYKPGHPVLEYFWKQEGSNVEITVKQVQDTTDGTPVYRIDANVGLIAGGKLSNIPISLDGTETTLKISNLGSVSAVLLDPDHDFLREMKPVQRTLDEWKAIFLYAPTSTDRVDAMQHLLEGTPSDEIVNLVAKEVEKDNGQFPMLHTVRALTKLEKPALRSLWIKELKHKDVDRRWEAERALVALPKDDETIKAFRALITDDQAVNVINTALDALATWDAKGNVDIFRKAEKMHDFRGRIKRAAVDALEAAGEKPSK